MNLDVARAAATDRPLLRQLMELYRYDLSEFDHEDADCDGFYGYRWFDAYWSDAERHPFVFCVDGHPAGFALVRTGEVTEMAEFFILRKYRRCRIGSLAARTLFAQFPGRWSISQVQGNTVALRFWRAVIPVPFDEQVLAEGGTEQGFTVHQ